MNASFTAPITSACPRNVHVKDVAANNLTQSPLKQEAEYFETFALVHHDLMTIQPVPVVANRDRRPS